MSARDDRARLRLLEAALLASILGLLLVGGHPRFWPIMTWPMYSLLRPATPGPEHAALELLVTERDGRVQRLLPYQLISIERDEVADALVEQALFDSIPAQRTAARQHIARLIRLALPRSDPMRAEVWRVYWHVDPLALPPLDRDSPSRRTRIGVLSFDGSAATGRSPP
jgi:hypothetical protein